MANINVLNAKGLARSLGRHQQFVTAMKRAGYTFRYGSLTTQEHALEWLVGLSPDEALTKNRCEQ